MITELTSVHNTHGQTVRREEQHHLIPLVFRVSLQLGLDILRKRLNETRVSGPSVDDTPVYSASGVHVSISTLAFQAILPLPQLVQ